MFMRIISSMLLLLLTVGLAIAQHTQAVGTNLSRLLIDAQTLIGAQPGGELHLKPGAKIAFMGDSITQQGGYVRLATYVLNTNYPNLKPIIINAGISSQMAEDMAPRFEKDMQLADKPAFCFISVGINDMWHRINAPLDQAALDQYTADVVLMVDKAQAAGATAVLLTPTLLQEDAATEGNKRLLRYVDAMKKIAADKKCIVIDLHTMFLKALATKPATLNLTVDGVHMTPYGDAIMAFGVLRALGLPDTAIVKTDITGVFMVPSMGMRLIDAAKELEVPPTRFFKPSLARLLSL